MKKLSLWLAFLTVCLVFLFTGLKAEAATFTNHEGVTNITLKNGPTFTPATSMEMKIDFDLSGLVVQPGDTLEIAYPDSIEGSGDPHFTFYDDNQELLATGLNQEGKIIITFTELVKDKTELKGFFDMKFKPVSNKMPLGKNTLAFETKKGILPIDIELIHSLKDLSKKGAIKELSNGEKIIRWTMIVNRNNLWKEKLILSDSITDPELKYIPGSLRVSEGVWTDEIKTSYKRVRSLTPNKGFSLTELENGINVHFPSGNKMYVVDLDTRLNDPSKLETLGQTFKNSATLTWGNEHGIEETISVDSKLVVKNNHSGIDGKDGTPSPSDSSSSDSDLSTNSTVESSTSTTRTTDALSSTAETQESSTKQETTESKKIIENSSNETKTSTGNSSFDVSISKNTVPSKTNSLKNTLSTCNDHQCVPAEKEHTVNDQKKDRLPSAGQLQRKSLVVFGGLTFWASIAILRKRNT